MPTAAASTVDRLAVAALAAQIAVAGGAVPEAIQLLPEGSFRADDGRPTDAPAWVLDAATAQRLIAQIDARNNPLPIDYEHQTVHSKANGQPAPAAGWFSALEWRPGSGLWATGVRWTDRARQMIAAGEYRYISPVFTYDRKTGRIGRLLHAALTNDPALDGMAAVAASSQLPLTSASETLMTIEQLVAACAAALGAQTALDADKLAPAIAALKADADKARADHATAEAALKAEREATAALKASTQPLEVVAALRAELATLTADSNARKIDDLVKPALADGRLLPAQEAWARDLGASNLAALSKYIETAQPIAALKGTQTGGAAPGGKAKADDADAIAQAALSYQAEQLRAGVQISTQAAVAHVLKDQAQA